MIAYLRDEPKERLRREASFRVDRKRLSKTMTSR